MGSWGRMGRATRLLGALAAGVITQGCAIERTVTGAVVDYETGVPIGGAEVTAVQHGWGFSSGSLVWDKDKSTMVATDAAGRFVAPFRWASSVRLRARAPGYQRFEAYYAAGDTVRIRLKERVADAPVLPSGFLRLGLRTDGTFYGWDFSRGAIASSAEGADILPVRMGEGSRDAITIRAGGAGGILFVPRSELGVDAMFLVYSDEAPEEGYEAEAVIDFGSEGGIYFVRTGDGEHYAKFAFTPSGFGQTVEADVTRDLSLHFVFAPDGSRRLLYQTIE